MILLDQESNPPADGMSWLGRRGPWRPRQGRGHPRHPPRCPRPPQLPQCDFAMSLLLTDVELGQNAYCS